MDNRLVRRVPEIKSDICPFCRNKLDQRIARCSNNLYNDGNIFEHELFYCGACDLWYAVKGKTMPFVLHNAFCFPLLKGKKYTLEMLRWRIFGKDPYAAVEGSKRFSPAVTWIDTSQNNVSKQKASTSSKRKSVSVNQNQPAQKHNEAEYRDQLKEQLIEKYDAPQSMVTMLGCTVEEIIGSAMSPPDEPAIIFLVSAFEDDQKRPNYYYIHGKVGQMIIRRLASHEKRFRINRGKQDFRYLVNYYYVGPMMDAFLKEERSKIHDLSVFEGIVDVKLYKGRNVCRSHGDIVQRVVAMLPGTRSDERHPLAV